MVHGIDCRPILSAVSLVASALKERERLVKEDNDPGPENPLWLPPSESSLRVFPSRKGERKGKRGIVYPRRIAN